MTKLGAKLTVFTGSMFASKTSALITKGERHLIAGHNVIYVKPKQDSRYSETELVTHNGTKVPAVTLDESNYLIDAKTWVAINSADVILMDEVQFYTYKALDIIDELLLKGKVIYVAGLDMDYNGDPFESTALLMGNADEVVKLKAVCSDCGEDSFVTAKKGGNEERLELGSGDIYKPLCRTCYQVFKGGEEREI